MIPFMHNTVTLVIGDLHLRDYKNNRDYLDCQVSSIITLLKKVDSNIVIFLGDVFHFRKPSAREILAFKKILSYIEYNSGWVHILRGNHDSETKGDDGITTLSVFDGYDGIVVHDHYGRENGMGFTFIPHYENQEIIEKALSDIPENDIVFGHFGYKGAYNSQGDYDSEVDLSCFKNRTLLGHVHSFKHASDLVTTLGTPFSTEYADAGKTHMVAMIDDVDSNDLIKFIPVDHGIRHLKFNYSELEANKDFINDPNRLTYLRVYFNELTDFNALSLRKEIFSNYNVRWVDVKFHPLVDTEKAMSTFETGKEIFTIDDTLIEKYVDENTTDIPKSDLMDGLEILKNEDQDS